MAHMTSALTGSARRVRTMAMLMILSLGMTAARPAHAQDSRRPAASPTARPADSVVRTAHGALRRDDATAALKRAGRRQSNLGVASFYGGFFAGRATANGEVFDPSRMTAAHRLLPLGTHLRVTNLENGRQVIVRVNDRGPYRKDRIIDLSVEAARRLGFLGSGVAQVKLEIVKPSQLTTTQKRDVWSPRASHALVHGTAVADAAPTTRTAPRRGTRG